MSGDRIGRRIEHGEHMLLSGGYRHEAPEDAVALGLASILAYAIDRGVDPVAAYAKARTGLVADSAADAEERRIPPEDSIK